MNELASICPANSSPEKKVFVKVQSMSVIGMESYPVTVEVLSLIHISEPTRLLSISYAVFCLKKKKKHIKRHETEH